MKRISSILVLIFISLLSQAKVYYLLPGSGNKNSSGLSASEVQDYLPTESYNFGDMSPEKQAYSWFTTTYSGGEQRVVTLKDIEDGLLDATTMQALWINIDRQGSSNLSNYGFTNDIIGKLSTYVKAGGSLLLTTYATQLAKSMGRYPHDVTTVGVNNYAEGDELWGVNAILGKSLADASKRDRRSHALYANLRTTTKDEGEVFPLLQANKHSDRNCIWNEYLNPQGQKYYNYNGDVRMIDEWEAQYNATALGTWTHIGDYCLPAIIDFKSDVVTWKGEIIAIGIAAYQWGNANISGDTDASFNIKQMTKNALDLLGFEEKEVTWTTAPTGGVVGGSSTCVATCTGSTSIKYVSSNTNVAIVNETTGAIQFNFTGTATITANAYDGSKLIGHASQSITITSGSTDKQIFYLLHSPMNTVVENNDADKTEQPEVNAINWFKENYASTGSFIDVASIPTTSAAEGKVMWIHVDRYMDQGAFDNLFPEASRNIIKSFVQNGGHLYLTGFAPRLAHLIGRAPEPVTVGWDNAFGESTDTWYVTANMSGLADRHEHAVYDQMAAGSYIDNYRYMMQYSNANKRSNRNCLWAVDGADNMKNWENNNSCQTLGCWGHTPDPTCAGLVEFFPNATYQGTIIGNGLAACSFATSNDYVEHVQNLTKGALAYLADDPVSTTTYTRATTAGKYGTICLERTSTKLEGATFYWPLFKTPDEGVVTSITLEEVDELTAGWGYFFLAEGSEVRVTMSLKEQALDSPVDNGTTTHGMHGVFTGTHTVLNLSNEMILKDNQLWYGAEGKTPNTVSDHRAYIKMSEVPKESEAQPVPGRRQARMMVNQPTTPTGWVDLLNAEQAMKVIKNGHLYITCHGHLYNIFGTIVK